MQVVVIANPVAGTSHGRIGGETARELLTGRGAEVVLHTTDHPGHATDLARDSAGSADVVVAVGGDGTLMETATGMVGTGCPLAVLPSGSGNDFATANGITNLEVGLESVFAGNIRELDVGDLDGDLFFNSVGLLGSGMVSAAAARLWRWLGRYRYVVAGGWVILRMSGQRVRWLAPGCEEAVIDDRFMLVEICNGPLTGGGFRFAPDAAFDDGLLDICLVRTMSAWTGLGLLPKASRGRIIDHGAVSVIRSPDMQFESDEPVGYHRDGEAGVLSPGRHRIRVREEKLLFCRPANQGTEVA
ncbi:hypothetical protein COW53_06605 [bacterium CG17_big_fil_post_rev_8_21_14_2_50_64_8]|nr:MAG: hypothetical protein COW53_06605 [bacterium CG17_big_fil_post_rev_8_21_14_2_50_64_8]PJA74213.1 MAG: hypothetical protein CO151_10405 [bacterium CG_4_9_14_3_um_filter_65_15]